MGGGGSRLSQVGVSFVLCCGLGGCGLLGTAVLQPGTYVGELPCRAIVTNPAGEEGQEVYDSPTTLIVGEDGSLTVNGELIEVGQTVTRAMPNATLGFEVVSITRGWGQVVVTYEPRPTLPGISVEGGLVEDYQRRADVIRAHGLADLVLTDVSGDSALQIDCSGSLTKE